MNTKIIFLLLLNLASAITLSGQQNRLFSEVQKVKDAKTEFKNISAFREVNAVATLQKYFIHPEDVQYYDYVPIDFKQFSSNKAFRLSIPSKGKAINLDLIEAPDYFYGIEKQILFTALLRVRL